MEFQKKCLGKMGQVAQSGRTVLFVSHNMAIVQNLCERAVLLTRGRVEAIGASADVLAAYLRSASCTDPERLPLSSYRKPGMMPIIQDITLRNSHGQATDHFYAGSELLIDIHYDSPLPLNNPVFGIFLLGGMGEKLCHLQTLSQHGPIPSLAQRGIVRCVLPEVPLAPGTYSLSFSCSSLHTKGSLDFLTCPLAFHVEAADYFGTGHLPPARNGSFLLKAEWSFLAPEDLKLQSSQPAET
jgi:lipopolysaccharide transport system ATP-binding protein